MLRTAVAALAAGRRAAGPTAAARLGPASAARSFAAASSSDDGTSTGPFTATLFPGDGAFLGVWRRRQTSARARGRSARARLPFARLSHRWGRRGDPPSTPVHPLSPPSVSTHNTKPCYQNTNTQKTTGIGPEIAESLKTIFAAAGVPVSWDEQAVGSTVDPATNSMVSRANLDSVLTHRIGLKGPMATPIGKGHRSLNLTLRKELQLYANVRPCFSIPGYKTRYDNVNLVTIRENTEGEYSGLEHEVVPGVVESLKVITRAASTRVAQYAFKYARDNGRERVTAVHKANIQKLGDGEFSLSLSVSLSLFFFDTHTHTHSTHTQQPKHMHKN